MRDALVERAYAAFRADAERPPPVTLRGGDAIDSYSSPPPYDSALDAPSDAYLERYAYWALTFLDAASWRHYLPALIDHTLRHLDRPTTMVGEGLLFSLRPPDREPPRLATLTTEQEAVIAAFLEELAFNDEGRAYQEDALLILEEWWLPNARYRPAPKRDA
jgi:hypothetical protein